MDHMCEIISKLDKGLSFKSIVNGRTEDDDKDQSQKLTLPPCDRNLKS